MNRKDWLIGYLIATLRGALSHADYGRVQYNLINNAITRAENELELIELEEGDANSSN